MTYVKGEVTVTGLKICGYKVMIAESGQLFLMNEAECADFPDTRGTHPYNWHERHGYFGYNPHCPYCYAGKHPDVIRAILAKYGQ